MEIVLDTDCIILSALTYTCMRSYPTHNLNESEQRWLILGQKPPLHLSNIGYLLLVDSYMPDNK